jgi:hypothetical protein
MWGSSAGCPHIAATSRQHARDATPDPRSARTHTRMTETDMGGPLPTERHEAREMYNDSPAIID